MSQALEVRNELDSQTERIASIAYNRYLAGGEDCEDALNALLRAAEHIERRQRDSLYGADEVAVNAAVDHKLNAFGPWAALGETAVVRGFARRSHVLVEPTRVRYHLPSPAYALVNECMLFARGLTRFTLAPGTSPLAQPPRLQDRPVVLVPDTNVRPETVTQQKHLLDELNAGREVPLRKVLHLGVSFLPLGDDYLP
jgi:hypothetical protein